LFDQEENELWIQDFKVERSEILSLYNMVTKDIADRINVALTPQQEKMLAESRSVNTEAYEAYLKATYYYDQLNLESIHLAKTYYNKAIEIDPDWAPPYAGLARYWGLIRQTGMAPDSVTIPKMLENIDMAKKLDPELIQIKLFEASFSVWTQFDWKKGEQKFLHILEINPNHAFARSVYAHLLLILRRDKEAITQSERAVKLDPLNPMVLSFYAIVAASIGENVKAIEAAEKALSIAPKQNVAIGALVTVNYNKGDYRSALNHIIDWNSLGEETRKIVLDTYDENGYEKAALKLAEAIEQSQNDPTLIADLYASAGKHAMAMDVIEQAYNDRDALLPYYGCSMYTKAPFKIEDPRFNELLKKLNLPLE
jgi:tetratricopeptide (TPR) repeat protein